MMKCHVLILICLIHCNCLLAQVSNFEKEAQTLLQEAIEENQTIGIAAGFSTNGELLWQDAKGLRDAEKSIPFSPSTKTRIASITKPMTAIAILQLYERGQLHLDTPIQTYLTSFPTKKEGNITIRQLLQHTAGIGGYKNVREQENTSYYATIEEAVNIFKDRPLVSTPGQQFNYSTYGYVILGLILEKISGMSYQTYMQANIWDKCEMNNTGVEDSKHQVLEKSRVYHKNSKGKIVAAEQTDLSDRIPGGGVYSTVEDLLKFGDAVISNELIKESTFSEMISNPNLKAEGNGYGMGWYLYGENPNYGNVIGHNGSQTGASTFLMLLPEVKTTIIVLSNTSGAMQAISTITVKLFDIAHNARK